MILGGDHVGGWDDGEVLQIGTKLKASKKLNMCFFGNGLCDGLNVQKLHQNQW